MTDAGSRRYRTLFLTIAAALAVWGLLGLRNLGSISYSGYTTDGNNTVIHVDAGSPAEAAGMRAGDVIVSTRGIAVEDSRARSRLGRVEIGGVNPTVVVRDGTEVTLPIQYAAQPRRDAFFGYALWLCGVLFLVLGVWAYLKIPNRGTLTWAVVGCSFSLSFMSGPYIPPGAIRSIAMPVIVLVVLLGFAALVDFLIRAGKVGAYSAGPGAPRWVYGPPLALGLMLIGLFVLQPAATSGLNVAVRTIMNVFFIGYLGAALVLVFRNYVKATGGVRAQRKLGLMLAAALAGLLPPVAVTGLNLISPSTFVDSAQFWILGILAVPIAFTLAVVHGSRMEAHA